MTISSTKADAERLKYVAITFVGVDPTNYDDTDVAKAFKHFGILGFDSDFIGLSADDIDALTVPGRSSTDPMTALSHSTCRKLKIITAFYHQECRRAGGTINMSGATKAMYDKFRTQSYDPNLQVVPWTVKLPGNDLVA